MIASVARCLGQRMTRQDRSSLVGDSLRCLQRALGVGHDYSGGFDAGPGERVQSREPCPHRL
jgi:hypothetical protein